MAKWLVLYNRGDCVWAFPIEANSSSEAVDIADSRSDTPHPASCVASIKPDQLEYFQQMLCKEITIK
jgi:hypothetical protein